MALMVKRVNKQLPDGHVRSFYQRVSLGDGPITSPDQDPTTGEIQMPDDYVGSTPAPGTTFDSSSSQTVATVGPIITGVPAATPGIATSITDTANAAAGWITSYITGTGPTAAAATPVSGAPMSPLAMFLVAGTVVGAYYAYKQMSKKTARQTTAKRRITTRRRR